MITDFTLALQSDLPFKVAYKRLRHIRHGHPWSKSVLLDKVHSEGHPQSSHSAVFTINIMKCNDCGLTWFDKGLETRGKL